MNTDYFPGKVKLRAGPASLLMLALAGAVFGCGDEEETVQQREMLEPSSQPEGERPPPREGPDGCYIPAQTRCDCAVSEADCTEDVGIWTMGCASCAAP
ncbi:MAG: hypothetical protein RL033_8145 [Pseudomonadota bacterium]|jgi:hypothetical protein